MNKITLGEEIYTCQSDESVLDTLIREDVDISYSCQKGTCHSCLSRSIGSAPPEAAQKGLKDTQKRQKYFLACLCYPEADMQIKLPDQSEIFSQGKVMIHEMLNHNTLLLKVECQDIKEYYAGQFVNLQRDDGLIRSYSIANVPQQDGVLELHVRRLPDGRFSEWMHDQISVGDNIAVSEPQGHCFYLPGRADQGLLLVGTGTGLAPLAGILEDALKHGHTGPVMLFHGARTVADLYRIDELRKFAQEYDNFSYIPCVSSEPAIEGFTAGRADQVALAHMNEWQGWRVFLCGHPEMVSSMKMEAFMQGVAMKDIYTDAFVAAG
ncbi:MAG TPA: 2Fe-2S iron-sulfur cluster binding domain-containing protein [Methyloprofundus sp.]|uniref:FAD-binding oxidoreductase n=1 Tax=Methyloprofundus sp. TaxID=2020875 RepID=UPI0017CC8D56|nr:FAD-binding oxidoreductase [Methyloprofundus sp.]HIG64463.1 2Fe-2S iron-sulfur cluster binding domain-containing protein [Methyloprofundus sp.]HIL79412.1 2Fe-2S iron-sulfur cluster binding domain-containing protein [Methylococcales bacterium]